MRSIQLVIAVALALLPGRLKIPIYRRVFGFRIGKGVRIGFSPFVGVGGCCIGDHVRIGSFNLFDRVSELDIGEHAQVGFLNLFRGGQVVRVGAYASILRQNVFNSIIDRDFIDPADPALELGTGVVITSGHWLDFSAGITIGDHSIVGGRNSSFWTHNRQRGRRVAVGCHCYLGSEIRVAPGAVVPSFSIVALGSVLSGPLQPARSLFGGNPAAAVRALRSGDLSLVLHKTRPDIPDELATRLVPDDLRTAAPGSGLAGCASPN